MSSQTLGTSVQARAQARFVRISPMKARRVIDLIRGKAVTEAEAILRFAPQSASEAVLKLLRSAVANARFQADQTAQFFDEAALVITSAHVDEGPTMKRFRPRAQGRASRILKRSSHITVVVGQLASTTTSATNSKTTNRGAAKSAPTNAKGGAR